VKRKLKVNLAELAIALDTNSPEVRNYLDLETGEIATITQEVGWDLEKIYDEIYDEAGNRVVTMEEYVQGRDDPDWQKEVLLEADRVEQGYGVRYILVERDDPYGDYNDMERFICRVEDPQLRERLWRAIKGRGAFRRFKDLLARHPDVRDQWFDFKDTRLERRLADWLEDNDIEPIS
jgi:hypothetical protein